MYDALAREQLHVEQDLLRRRLEAAARLPRAWELQDCTTPPRRRWSLSRRHAAANC
ncbi:MAG: hypothetical protein QOD07_1567 [Frankiaceae bacterium]|nr:hypothetical protein [Frankiaceae bacterium]